MKQKRHTFRGGFRNKTDRLRVFRAGEGAPPPPLVRSLDADPIDSKPVEEFVSDLERDGFADAIAKGREEVRQWMRRKNQEQER